nr:immunoglobulin heavy chain junction region [Mus musculus]
CARGDWDEGWYFDVW